MPRQRRTWAANFRKVITGLHLAIWRKPVTAEPSRLEFTSSLTGTVMADDFAALQPELQKTLESFRLNP